jgi:hypothetical protein
VNGVETKIEIFKPFGEAFELMTNILFRPFELKKWLVIGFAAFLASFSGSFQFNANPFSGWSDRQDRRALAEGIRGVGSLKDLDPGLFVAVVLVSLLALAIIFVLFWIGSRGRFIFTDCIVHNRGAIVAPWKEFRREGNSFFLFSLLAVLLILALLATALLPLLLPLILRGDNSRPGVEFWIGFSLVISFIILVTLAWALISQMLAPIMYRQRCLARDAFGQVVRLIAAQPGPLILYFLFFLVIAIAGALISCLAACVTCCIAAIPYIGSVILLPISVTLYGFTLLFLRQFGPDYDVWAGAVPVVQVPPSSIEPLPPSGEPPVQT